MDDPRFTPARPEVAAKYLEGKVTAARFVAGESFVVTDAIAPLRTAPRADAMLQTQALLGERVTIYDRPGEGWAWGQLDSDGYVGWLPEAALGKLGAAPTHKVAATRTFAFPGPSIKLPPHDALPFGATVAVARTEGSFAVTTAGVFLPTQHLAPINHRSSDMVAVAEMFLGTPYLWGGKTTQGLDCSGLVHIAMTAAGRPCPRDSDMQEQAFGTTAALDALRRGDLVFWKGHVAIARDSDTLVHANAFHMMVAIEPVTQAVARIAAAGSPVTSVRRP
jgi:cell wall-associated NlpC family hydrolase